MLSRAARDARAIARERTPWALPWSATLEAGIAHLRGDDARAATLLERAAIQAGQGHMAMVAAAAQFARGKLVSGDEGARLVAESLAWFSSEGVATPERMIALFAPALGA